MMHRVRRIALGVGALLLLAPTAALGAEPTTEAPTAISAEGQEYDGPFVSAPDPQSSRLTARSAYLGGTPVESPGAVLVGTRLDTMFDGAVLSLTPGRGTAIETWMRTGRFVRVQPGSELEAGGRFQAETAVEAWLFPAGIHLATTTADATGNAVLDLQMPGDLAPCTHTLYLRGMFDKAIVNDVGTVIIPADPEGQLLELTAGIGAFAYPYPFSDVGPDNPHRLAVGCFADRGVTQGTSATSFSPWQAVTRGQAASLLARDAALVSPGASHLAAAQALGEIGVLQGDTDGELRLAAPLTRGQAASLLARLHDLAQPSSQRFDDSGGTHRGPISALADLRVVHGYGDGTFGPDDPVERAAFISMMFRLEQAMIEVSPQR